MRLRLLGSCIGLALSGWLAASPASAVTMNLVVSDSHIKVGEHFTIAVWANDAALPSDEVIAFGFDNFNSDSAVVKLLSWQVGPLFNDDSGLFPNTAVAGSAFPGLTDNNILLATLSFEALQVGSATVGIGSNIQDPNEGLIYFQQGNVDIATYTPISVVPEPASVALFAFGLAGFAALRRRIRHGC